ncbi:MAG: hypothetical protein ACQEW9_03240 [Bacteroidota bacterium]
MYLIGLFFPVLCMVLVVVAALFLEINSDISTHIDMLWHADDQGKYNVPPLYFLNLKWLGQLFYWRPSYKLAALILLVLAVFFKFQLSLNYLRKSIDPRSKSYKWIPLCTGALFFIFPLVMPGWEGEHWYLGKFTSSIWLNSTTVFVFPFAIALFALAFSWLMNPKKMTWQLLVLLGLINILIKPSFLFVLIPGLPIYYLVLYGKLDKGFFLSLLASVLWLGVLWVMKNMIYHSEIWQDKIFMLNYDSKVVFRPGIVFELHSETLFWDIISSFALLFLAWFFLGKRLWRERDFQFSLMLFLGSIAVYLLFAETGKRMIHGNFYWQIPITLFILQLITLKNLLQFQLSKPKLLLLLLVWALHAASLMAFFVRWVTENEMM